MKEINLNFSLKGLDNVEVPEANAGKMLAQVLSADNGKNPMKFYSWAKELYAGTPLKLDPQDIELLKTFVTDTVQLNALQKAQILEKI